MGWGDPIWGHRDLRGVGTYRMGVPIGEHGDLWGVETPYGDVGTYGE